MRILEDKSSKKRHCTTDGYQLNVDGEISCSSQGYHRNMQSGVVAKSGAAIVTSKELPMGNDSVELEVSLRKCNKASMATVSVTGCDTPGPFTNKIGSNETPKSTRGSSIFSPGETFWNEAIQVADGLYATNNKLPDEMKVDNLRNDRCGNKSNKVLHEVASGVCDARKNASLASLGEPGKCLDKEVSPLPVKHFDFSLEEKNSNENALLSCSENKSTFLMHGEGEQARLHDVQEMTSSGAIAKRKADLYTQDNDSITSTTPDKEIRNFTGNIAENEDSTPSSFVLLKDHLDLNNWLPSEICSIYMKRGISKLYPWQVDCLLVDGVLQRRNLVYCASTSNDFLGSSIINVLKRGTWVASEQLAFGATSAGKSFVAEILMLRRVLSTGKMALLVLPYVSICTEKAEHLESLLEPLHKHVRSYYGNQGGGTLPKDTSVAVCTIEKANSLINRLLEEGRMSEVGIIVIDELHMVGDQNRGYLLELMLTKLRYAAGEGIVESSSGESSGNSSGKTDPAHGLQIVGMSATLPNVAAVADWLQAALYQTDFRPVPLEEYIKVGNTIYNKKMEIVRTISKRADLGVEQLRLLGSHQVVQAGHSVLLFCSSRKGCESTASHVAKYLKEYSANSRNDQSEFTDINSAIDTLRNSPAGLDPVLEVTLPYGVAYHHAGLTVEEREVVESCYRKGLVRVLTATSTLAAGVNLPARRVIFRQPRIGRDFIDGTRYRQMAGRAGRTGIDTKGESVLICKPEEIKRITGLLNDSCPPLHSCLSEDKNGMTHAILEVVAGGIVQTANDIHRYVRCTLLNSTKPFEAVVKSAQDSLMWLCHRKFLEWSEETKLYTTTPLGRASFGSSLCPEESLIVLDDLSRAREGFVLASDLHLVYLVTPINVDVEPDWELYYERFMELSALDQSVGNRVGVQEPFLMRMAHGAPMRTSNRSRDGSKGLQSRFDLGLGIANHGMLSDEQIVRVCKRFYVALILSKLVQEVPVTKVCEAFKVARGMVQGLQENAGRFASMVSVFCERLGWHDLEGLVSRFQNRVSFGVRAEIVELTTIPYVKGSRARALYKAGLRTIQAIAEASVPEIVKAIFESSSWAAQEGTAQRRVHLGLAKKIKNGARKIVLDKAEEARVVAFSAFKSLGLDVPQFAQPLLFAATDDTIRKEEPTSSGEENTPKFVGLENTKPVLAEPFVQVRKYLNEVTAEIEGDKSTKVSGVNIDNTDTSLSLPLARTNNENRICSEHLDHVGQEQDDSAKVKENASDKGPVNAVSTLGGFDSFLDLWDTAREFFFDIHFNKRSEVNYVAPFEIHGIAICWENSPVYYVNLPKDLFWCDDRRNDYMPTNFSATNCLEIAKGRWKRIGYLMGKKDVRKFTWNLKVQIQVLKSPSISIQRFGSRNLAVRNMGLELIDSSYYMFSPIYVKGVVDISIVAWILWPDEERSSSPNLEKEVKKRLSSEAAAAANRNGRWKNQMRRAAHNGCCRRVAQTRALCSVFWKLLASEGLCEALMTIETPLVHVLADMELWGIGVDMEGCLRARHLLGKKLRYLEKEAYKLAGMTFSMYTAADIANVLYNHLKLPIPEGHNKWKQHPSTDKHCLDLLRKPDTMRQGHPIIPVIKEHRTLAKLLNCTLGSICSLSKLSMRTQKYSLHGHWLQTSTATGRLSIEEPNLQCVEHMVDFKMNNNEKDDCDSNTDHHEINARDFFVPTQENWLLLTADYSQIELRLMAHFSKDSSLIELLNKPHGDVFTMVAAKWTGKEESDVSSQEREQTKRLIYGILYGMGANTLAEQLDCSSADAAEKIQSFKSSFPAVASWLLEAVSSCRQKGYVETLKGRKRFLAKIKFGNSEEKSRAQRQAVNSICQGSAADIIKIAMINIHSTIIEDLEKSDSSTPFAEKFQMLKGRCRILLQVHDELVLEADPSVLKEAGLLLRMSMETAASLLGRKNVGIPGTFCGRVIYRQGKLSHPFCSSKFSLGEGLGTTLLNGSQFHSNLDTLGATYRLHSFWRSTKVKGTVWKTTLSIGGDSSEDQSLTRRLTE
ncbi:hypothetical protein LguiA_036395 [Lonicera macranthoides]